MRPRCVSFVIPDVLSTRHSFRCAACPPQHLQLPVATPLPTDKMGSHSIVNSKVLQAALCLTSALDDKIQEVSWKLTTP